MNILKFEIKSQPFIFLNRRPDFLIDNHTVIEIKCEQNLSDQEIKSYMDWSEKMKAEFGYNYQIRYMWEEYRKEYREALYWLKRNASIGVTFTLLTEI
jgi:hypothetical protein